MTMAWEKRLQKGLKQSPSGCLEWQKSLMDGYGCIQINGKSERTHRFAWTLAYGEIPEGKQVCHHCDNRKCCRPEHLFLGTIQDNMDDRNEKGRQAKLKGELNGSHKLSECDVLEIYKMKEDGAKNTVIAARYGVTPTTIGYIIKGRLWKHLLKAAA